MLPSPVTVAIRTKLGERRLFRLKVAERPSNAVVLDESFKFKDGDWQRIDGDETEDIGTIEDIVGWLEEKLLGIIGKHRFLLYGDSTKDKVVDTTNTLTGAGASSKSEDAGISLVKEAFAMARTLEADQREFIKLQGNTLDRAQTTIEVLAKENRQAATDLAEFMARTTMAESDAEALAESLESNEQLASLVIDKLLAKFGKTKKE